MELIYWHDRLFAFVERRNKSLEERRAFETEIGRAVKLLPRPE